MMTRERACAGARLLEEIAEAKESIVRLAMRDALDNQVALISSELDRACCRLRDLKATRKEGWVKG